jgi:site-specific DNA recombinase
MKPTERRVLRCAIYTRKSTEHNLDLEFNSLDAQREACDAYVKSQAHEGWRLIADRYDDGAFSGASLERPALQNVLADVRSGKINIVVVRADRVDGATRPLPPLPAKCSITTLVWAARNNAAGYVWMPAAERS